MFDRRALLIGADKAMLYEYRGGRLVRSYVFSAGEASIANFARYLADTPKSPVYVLVDVVEEEYRQDLIPHVFGSDRESVLERKFARLFRATGYRHALIQGREAEGRRDDKVLLTALIKPDIVTPWIRFLQQHKVPIGGIYSLPILSQLLLKKIDATGSNILLITVQNASGLRQTFFRDGHMKISRLATMPRLGSVPYARHVLGELEKLRRYLNSLALLSRDRPLEVYILSQGRLLNELERECRDSDEERFFLLDTADVAGRLGIAELAATPYSDAIFAWLLLDTMPRNHYASTEETQYFRLHRAKRGLLAASVLLLLGSMGWSGFNFIEGVSLKQQAFEAAEKAKFYAARYDMAHEQLPPTPVGPHAIKTAVDIVSALERRKSSPMPLLSAIGGVLEQFPGVEVDRIEWQTGSDPNVDDQRRRQGPAPDGNPIPRDAAYSHYHIGVLQGHMRPFAGDYRRAIADVDALAETLKTRPGMHHVEVIAYPLDVDSAASLSGSPTEGGEKPQARFAIKLVLGISDGSRQG